MNYEQQALELIKENEALKSQVNMTREQLQNTIDYIWAFEGKFCDFGEHLWQSMPQTKLNYSNAKAMIDKTPEQCLNSIRTSAIRDLATMECPVSGYIITSEESRRQMIGWADFEDGCNNEKSS
ncbi:MAG: hypothetical protein Unbinned706contig1000_54 [Prokaryotic dsDNA virus sp.]|nr:MAG: hypothetical protein Unbinned706contig1000_54 [Prokaryotic dsDNA virus sp.]|tara:strand:- start:1282 stop:1653 length:372 start_codon:yes stop_codon:yes gene_type:complete